MPTGGEIVVDWMRASGLTHFFNVPGESFLPVLDALRDEPGIRLVTNRHESGAAFAAEAFAKVSGRPAVCMATRGPGAANLSIGVQTAYYDSTPMMALVGLVPTHLRGSRAFQEFDPSSMYGSISKGVLLADDVAGLADVLARGLHLATTGRPGPVVVGLPSDVLYAQGMQAAASAVEPEVVDPLDLSQVIDLLKSARRPALISASSAVRGEAAEMLGRFAAATGLPVFTAWRRFSAFDNGHPNYAGPLGLGTAPSVRSALSSADVVVCLGFVEQITAQQAGLGRSGQTVVQVAPENEPHLERHLGEALCLQLVETPERAARGLADWATSNAAIARDMQTRHGEATGAAASAVAPPPARDRPGGVHLDYFMERMNRLVPANALVTSDAGNFAQWLLRYFRFDRQRSFIGPLNGAMGYGIPAAIGGSLGAPGQPTWCVGGDGGLLMTIGELETVTRLGLNATVVAVNNHAYGTIRARQYAEYPSRLTGTDLGTVDFARLAAAMGWASRQVRCDSEIDDALAEASETPGRRLIELLVEPMPLSLDASD
jgi:acetolactate synthase-1/2/3 large subunit